MVSHAPSPPTGPLIAVTILTSICLHPVEASNASELAAQSAMQTTNARENPLRSSILSSADGVADSRWARQREDYVAGEKGEIVLREQVPDVTGRQTGSHGDGKSNYPHFDIDPHQSDSECGPSPATPDEITRLVVEAAQRHKVDVGFAVAVATAESRLNRFGNSPKGARGPMQLMPAAAERFGVSDICNPEQNIDGGVRYLRELTDEFHNPLLAAAAYNAGEGSVREHGGIPPFKETLRYVAEVMNIQMRLEGSIPFELEGDPSSASQNAISNMNGVITSRERRQWVGGVMHF